MNAAPSTAGDSGAAFVAVVLKGYPRLSETFIAEEIRALERAGVALMLFSLRRPTERQMHPVHRAIRAPVVYLPEYLYREPRRVLRAWWRLRRAPGYRNARRIWWRDLRRDLRQNRGPNRIRRFGQALVLAAELPPGARLLYAHFLHTPASVARYAAALLDRPWSVSAHAKDIWTLPAWEKREKLADCAWLTTCTRANYDHLRALAAAGKVQLNYHGIDTARFAPAPVDSGRDGDGGDGRRLRDGRVVSSGRDGDGGDGGDGDGDAPYRHPRSLLSGGGDGDGDGGIDGGIDGGGDGGHGGAGDGDGSRSRDGRDPANPVQILSVGRAVAKKGYAGLLTALATLPPELHWRFTHLGGGPQLPELKRQAAKLGLAARIDWQGAQAQSQVLAHYRAADLFALNCRITADGDRDGLPNVLVEAQGCALPAVATNLSGIPELITAGENGLLVAPDNPTAFAAALHRLITDPALRRRLGATGRATVAEKFDRAQNFKQLRRLLAG